MKKKGQLTFKPLIELLIAVAIFLTFIYVGKSFGTGEIFQKTRITNELQLTIDVLTSLPDNANMIYISSPSKYKLTFDDSSLKTELRVNDQIPSKRFFVNNNLDYYFDNPEALILSKSGNKIIITTEKTSLDKFICPNIDFSINKIIITPRLFNDQPNYFGEQLAYSIPNSEIREKIEIDNPEALILDLIQVEDAINIKTALNTKSKKIGCLIANNLIEKNPEKEINLQFTEEYPNELYILIELDKNLENSENAIAISNVLT